MSSLAGVLRKEEEAKSRFLLTSSVYCRCCESDCDCFLKLFATDEQASMVFAALKRLKEEKCVADGGEGEKSVVEDVRAESAKEERSEQVVNEAVPEHVADEAVPEHAADSVMAEHIANEAAPEHAADNIMAEHIANEAAPEHAADEAVPENTTEVAPEPVTNETTSEATHETVPITAPVETPSNQSFDITEKKPGTYLSLLLLHVLSAPVDPSLQTQVASLLLACFLHADSVDPLFDGLPVISDLFAAVCSDQEMNHFLDKQFSRLFVSR